MAFEHKPGTFSLFKNEYKAEGDNKPTYKGSGKDLDGQEIEVAAWLRNGQSGEFMSCTFKRKEKKPAEPAKSDGHPAMAGLDDDVPF
jgi:hypothetical protein